jgi:uncharacterized protein (DUF2252 family)
MRGAKVVEDWLLEDLFEDARAAPEAIALKLEKLGRHPFSFFRGTLPAYVRAVRPALTGRLAEAQGLVLGDLHLENFGTFLNPSGQSCFDLNDFDEVTRGPLVIDLRRLAASAALVSGSAAGARAVLQGFAHGCELGMDLPLAVPRSVRALLVRSRHIQPARFLAHATIVEARRLRLRLGQGLHPGPPELQRAVHAAVGRFRQRSGRGKRHALLDLARRLAGNGSLGRRRYLALVSGLGPSPVLIDLKEPRPSPWGNPTTLLGVRPRASQVEQAARRLRAHSEAILGTAPLHGTLFQLREHSPHGLKLDASALSADALLAYARYVGALLARAWRRADQPVQVLCGALAHSGDVLIQQCLADAAQARADHARFVVRRRLIARRLALST